MDEHDQRGMSFFAARACAPVPPVVKEDEEDDEEEAFKKALENSQLV